MNKDKRNNIKLLGTLNNADESGIIANANQVYDANEDKSTQDVSKEHTERIKDLEAKEDAMQTTLENITKTGEASAASNVTYNHNDSKLDATNMQQAIDEVYSKGNTNRENDKTELEKSISDNKVTVDASIQDVYKKSNYNDGDNIVDFNTIHFIKSNKKYVCAIVDNNDNVLIGLLRKNGTLEYGYDIPQQVKAYVDSQITSVLSSKTISDITDFLQGFSTSDTLKTLLAQKVDKTDIDKIYNKIPQLIEHPKYVYSVLDNDSDILWAVNKIKKVLELFLSLDIDGDFSINGVTISLKENPKYCFAILDANDNVIEAIKYNGERECGADISKDIKYYIDDIISNNNNKLDSNVKEIKDTISNLSSAIPFSKEIPSYYNEYITSRIADINNSILSDNGYNDSFIFLTDTHWGYGNKSYTNNGQSLKLIKYILANTPIDKVFYGGDVSRADATKEELFNIALMFVQQCRKELKPYAEIYCVNGNHDFSFTPPSGSTKSPYFYPMVFNKNIFMDKNLNTSVVTNEDDKEALYYYVDNKAQRIRYVVFNSTESHNINGVIHTNGAYIRKEQYDWMFSAIKSTPKEYKLVLQCHVPSSTGYYTTNKEFDIYVKSIIDKKSVTINNTVYDFADIADTIFVLSGHEHMDAVTYQNGIPWIVTACDANYSTYKGGQFGSKEDYQAKTKGTIYEQTFDIVNIDLKENLVQFIRIGGGYDRLYHLEISNVSIGNTIFLTSKIGNPVWEICDATGNSVDWSAHTWEYSKANASIRDNAVTGIKEGYAVVCAKDTTNKKMEFFGIEITK